MGTIGKMTIMTTSITNAVPGCRNGPNPIGEANVMIIPTYKLIRGAGVRREIIFAANTPLPVSSRVSSLYLRVLMGRFHRELVLSSMFSFPCETLALMLLRLTLNRSSRESLSSQSTRFDGKGYRETPLDGKNYGSRTKTRSL